MPEAYLDALLMREFGLKPWEIDEKMSAGELNDLIAVLQAERMAEKARSMTPGG